MKLAVAFTLLATAAGAQGVCGSQDQFVKGLAQQYGEETRFTALSNGGRLIQIFVNAETGSWTAIAINPDGSACMIDAGGDAEVIAPGEPA